MHVFADEYMHVYQIISIQTYTFASDHICAICIYISYTYIAMGWLWLVGSIKV